MKSRGRHAKFSKDEIEILIYKYVEDKRTLTSLAEEYSRSQGGISGMLVRNGITLRQRRKYTINEDYFSIIDTEEKAYWLGFLYADGTNGGDKSSTIAIALQRGDIEHLEKFNSAINSNRPIREIESLKPNGLEMSLQAKVDVYSRKMCRDLTRLGCHQNKTFAKEYD